MKQENRAYGEHSKPIEPIPSLGHEVSLHSAGPTVFHAFREKTSMKKFDLERASVPLEDLLTVPFRIPSMKYPQPHNA